MIIQPTATHTQAVYKEKETFQCQFIHSFSSVVHYAQYVVVVAMGTPPELLITLVLGFCQLSYTYWRMFSRFAHILINKHFVTVKTYELTIGTLV